MQATHAHNSFAIAILAAGKGTRLKSKLPKVIHSIGGRTLLGHVITAGSAIVNPADIFCIIGHEAARVREAVASYGTQFVEQTEQRGTGHAIMQCRNALRQYEHVLVLSGDVPLIRPETIASVRDFHIENKASMTILTAEPSDPFGYGRIVRRGHSHEVEAIVEQKQLSEDQLGIAEINSGIYAFHVADLFDRIDKLSTDNPHGEFYLTDIVRILQKDNKRVLALRAEDSSEILGVNTRAHLSELDALVRNRKCQELMDNGVTIYRPETCVIDSDVKVGSDTVIEPFVQLLGMTTVGEDCVLRSFTVLRNTQVGDSVTFFNGVVSTDSTIENRAQLGPYTHLRPLSHIGPEAHLGNFVETKKTRVGRGSKANHLSYLGDTEIGEKVNVGAGTITCNYDGVNKHPTVIADGAFIGSDTTLVAPVKVGRGAYVGASSCITRDVPDDALGVSRAPMVVKEGWAARQREIMQRRKNKK